MGSGEGWGFQLRWEKWVPTGPIQGRKGGKDTCLTAGRRVQMLERRSAFNYKPNLQCKIFLKYF